MIRIEYAQEDDFTRVVAWNAGTSPEFLAQWAGPMFMYPLTVEELERHWRKAIRRQDAYRRVGISGPARHSAFPADPRFPPPPDSVPEELVFRIIDDHDRPESNENVPSAPRRIRALADDRGKPVNKSDNDEPGRPRGEPIIGVVELCRIDRQNEAARIARFLIGAESARGRGAGSEALRALLAFSFSALALHRVTLGVFDFNYRAIRCYERAGFRAEGTMRDSRKVGNVYWSHLEMAILRSDWRDDPSTGDAP